jgi:hypothetical protein
MYLTTHVTTYWIGCLAGFVPGACRLAECKSQLIMETNKRAVLTDQYGQALLDGIQQPNQFLIQRVLPLRSSADTVMDT